MGSAFCSNVKRYISLRPLGLLGAKQVRIECLQWFNIVGAQNAVGFCLQFLRKLRLHHSGSWLRIRIPIMYVTGSSVTVRNRVPSMIKMMVSVYEKDWNFKGWRPKWGILVCRTNHLASKGKVYIYERKPLGFSMGLCSAINVGFVDFSRFKWVS